MCVWNNFVALLKASNENPPLFCFQIYLPTGTHVKVQVSGQLVNLWIVASPNDWGKTRGESKNCELQNFVVHFFRPRFAAWRLFRRFSTIHVGVFVHLLGGVGAGDFSHSGWKMTSIKFWADNWLSDFHPPPTQSIYSNFFTKKGQRQILSWKLFEWLGWATWQGVGWGETVRIWSWEPEWPTTPRLLSHSAKSLRQFSAQNFMLIIFQAQPSCCLSLQFCNFQHFCRFMWCVQRGHGWWRHTAQWCAGQLQKSSRRQARRAAHLDTRLEVSVLTSCKTNHKTPEHMISVCAKYIFCRIALNGPESIFRGVPADPTPYVPTKYCECQGQTLDPPQCGYRVDISRCDFLEGK